jgi:hypothetical protein
MADGGLGGATACVMVTSDVMCSRPWGAITGPRSCWRTGSTDPSRASPSAQVSASRICCGRSSRDIFAVGRPAEEAFAPSPASVATDGRRGESTTVGSTARIARADRPRPGVRRHGRVVRLCQRGRSRPSTDPRRPPGSRGAARHLELHLRRDDHARPGPPRSRASCGGRSRSSRSGHRRDARCRSGGRQCGVGALPTTLGQGLQLHGLYEFRPDATSESPDCRRAG